MRVAREKDCQHEKTINTFIRKYFWEKIFEKVDEVTDTARQLAGIDYIIDDQNVDVKAQSSVSYINNPRDTFILELSFLNGVCEESIGWFINPNSHTDIYAFVWISSATVGTDGRIHNVQDIHQIEIMLVDKHKLKEAVNKIYSDQELLEISLQMRLTGEHRKDGRVNGIHFSHSPTLFEKPTNIVARKWFLKQFATMHCKVTQDSIIHI